MVPNYLFEILEKVKFLSLWQSAEVERSRSEQGEELSRGSWYRFENGAGFDKDVLTGNPDTRWWIKKTPCNNEKKFTRYFQW